MHRAEFFRGNESLTYRREDAENPRRRHGAGISKKFFHRESRCMLWAACVTSNPSRGRMARMHARRVLSVQDQPTNIAKVCIEQRPRRPSSSFDLKTIDAFFIE
jgi:hypothetical protein